MDDDSLCRDKLYRQRHALLALLLGINLGHWLPDLVSRRVARMVGVTFYTLSANIA